MSVNLLPNSGCHEWIESHSSEYFDESSTRLSGAHKDASERDASSHSNVHSRTSRMYRSEVDMCMNSIELLHAFVKVDLHLNSQNDTFEHALNN
jgi:hypothetical protein